MTNYHYQLFHDDLLDDAAELLAARHQRDQQRQPLLANQFTDVTTTRQAIVAQWQHPFSSGVAAFDGDRMIGYLIGTMQVDQFFGRAVWSRLAGHAVAADVDSDLYRDLYAAAAPQWLQWGCFDHIVLVPAAPAYLEPWAMLTFGRMQAYSILPLDKVATPISTTASTKATTTATATATTTSSRITIRRALHSDAEHLRTMAFLTAGHQLKPPTWALTPPENMVGRPDQFADIVNDEEAICWLALIDDEPAGYQVWYAAETAADALDIPEQSIELASGGTLPAWRGRGVTRALTTHGLAHAQSAGYHHAVTNWRTTNLLSSRTWPRMGFVPVMYRLHRHVDERIAWGHNASEHDVSEHNVSEHNASEHNASKEQPSLQ